MFPSRSWSIRWLLLAVAVLGTIGCDHVTKHVATTTLAGMPSRSYLSNTVLLGYVENSGGFLGLGDSLPPRARTLVFTHGVGLMLLALGAAAARRRWERWPALGVALFFAGSASNWIDRVLRGVVVDFLNVGIGPLRTGVFNVADVAIMIGAALYITWEFRTSHVPPCA